MTDSVTPQPHVPVETKGKQKTIAVVAEQWHLRALVRAAVENKRTSVVEASSLEELRTIACGVRIDLVILDAETVCDDEELEAALLTWDGPLAEVPVILLTDQTAPEETSLPGSFPPFRTLHKHFSPFELLNFVYTLIGY